jgi:hypothetical protein
MKNLFITTLVLFAITTNAQITKGNWMVGGNASFSFHKTQKEDGSSSSDYSIIQFSPNVGYFIISKLSVGTLFDYSRTKSTYQGFGSTSKSSRLGPFVRYYILKPEKDFNFFIEPSYNFSVSKNNGYKDTSLSSKFGGVYFLNSSVGFECFFKYSLTKYKYNSTLISDSTDKGFLIGLGFQIHLEK